VFAGVDYPTGSATEKYLGCTPTEFSIEYEQEGMATFTLSLLYADQEPDPTEDLTTATRVADDTSVPWHGMDYQVDGTTVQDLQSASLSISDIARLQYGASPTANRGVIAAPSATLDVEAIFTAETRLDLARGASSSAPPDRLSSVTGTLTLSDSNGTVSTYNLSGLKPDTWSWNQILATEDTTDSVTFNITDDNAVSIA
jgi:hypothetical protein